MIAGDVAAARQLIVNAWMSAKGTPYFYGGKPGDRRGLDCSGLVQLGWMAAGVWPFPHEASAAMIYARGQKIPLEAALAGDVVVFGSADHVHHVVGVISQTELIGANHGFPPAAGETETAYRARIAAAGAGVVVCGHDYWASERVCAVRAPDLAA